MSRSRTPARTRPATRHDPRVSAAPGGSPPRHAWVCGVLLVVVVAVVYWPVLGYEAVWDDAENVLANPRFAPVTSASLLTFWTAPYLQLYIPVTYTAWGLLVWSSTALGLPLVPLLHGANLLGHAVNTLLVWRLVCRVLPGWCRYGLPPLSGALLFAVHPLQVQAVAWLSCWKDIGMACWALLAILGYLRAVQASTPSRCWWAYSGATLAFILALLSKPNAVTVPLLAGLLAVLCLHQPWKHAVRWLIPWGVLAVACVLVTGRVQPLSPGDLFPPPWPRRPLIALDTLGLYLRNLAVPVTMTLDYGHSLPAVQAAGWRAGLWLVPVGGAAVLWWQRQRWRAAAVGGVLFVVAVLPVLGLVPFQYQVLTGTVADRYAYLALLGPALALAWGLSRAARHRTPPLVLRAVSGVLLLGLLGLTLRQLPAWRTKETLARHTLRVTPESYWAGMSLAATLHQQGRFAEAAAQYRRVCAAHPGAGLARLLAQAVAGASGTSAADTAAALVRALALRPGPPFDACR